MCSKLSKFLAQNSLFFRFGIMGGKNSKQIQVQQNLDLTHFWVHRQSQPNCELNYRLVSLVSHIGPSSNCGHYTAIGLTSLGQFYLFDDSTVSHLLHSFNFSSFFFSFICNLFNKDIKTELPLPFIFNSKSN